MISVVAEGLAHLDEGQTVVVACSGGPDSSALAFLAAEARPDLELVLAHVRHGLRDDRAERELVRQHGDWLGVPVAVRDVEIVADRQGMEAAARQARYAALRSVAAEVGAASILVGHTADDQAETVLFRLVRGTGIDGLRGMTGISADLTRPLLWLRRRDVHEFLRREGLPSCVDPTNQDLAVRRAVIRHEALPRLELAAPDPVGALCRLSELVRADVEALEQLTEPLLAEVRWFARLAIVASATLADAPTALARRLLRAVLQELTGVPPAAVTVERILNAEESSAASLPRGVEFRVAGGWCTIGHRVPPRSGAVELTPGAITEWEPAGVAIEVVPLDDEGPTGAGPVLCPLPGLSAPRAPAIAARVVPPGGRTGRCTLTLPHLDRLTVRHAMPGDRIRTAVGRRTVADLLGDARMPRLLRKVWPVVAAGSEVVWVPGVGADEALRCDGRWAPGLQLVLRPATAGRRSAGR